MLELDVDRDTLLGLGTHPDDPGLGVQYDGLCTAFGALLQRRQPTARRR